MSTNLPAVVPTGTGTHRSRSPTLILATLCAAVLVAQLDTSVVNLAARPIGQYFHAGMGKLQWILDSYNLVYAALLLTGGLFADLTGRRRMFMVGAGVLTGASLSCAVAPTAASLIAGRALAGAGAALLLPASLAIVRVTWPDPVERGRALGIWAGCNGLAVALGPTLGGLLIDHFGWRSVFLALMPLSLTAVLAAPTVLPESRARRRRRFDPAGQVLGAAALAGVAGTAIEAHSAPGLAAVAAAVTVVAFGLLIPVERRMGAKALIPLHLFRVSAFSRAMAATAGMTFGMYGVLFLLPLTWQSRGVFGPTGAGVALMPMAGVFMLVSSFSGMLTARWGRRFVTGAGLATMACGVILIGATSGRVSIAASETGLALAGLGMGMATGPLMETAMGAVSAARSGTAASLINVARMVGATLGVAVLGSVHAVAGGGADGLRQALGLGAAVQFFAAGVVWFGLRPRSGLVGVGSD
ncbi:MAG: MFS transporter [Ectothiorhodospiraceae bacterium]|jgi:EmrB/QacA subfamily drug resistance transporter